MSNEQDKPEVRWEVDLSGKIFAEVFRGLEEMIYEVSHENNKFNKNNSTSNIFRLATIYRECSNPNDMTSYLHRSDVLKALSEMQPWHSTMCRDPDCMAEYQPNDLYVLNLETRYRGRNAGEQQYQSIKYYMDRIIAEGGSDCGLKVATLMRGMQYYVATKIETSAWCIYRLFKRNSEGLYAYLFGDDYARDDQVRIYALRALIDAMTEMVFFGKDSKKMLRQIASKLLWT